MAKTPLLVDCRFSLLVVEFRSLWFQKREKADVSGLASLAVALFDYLSKFGSDAYTIRLIHS
jgi:hypothetical protein